MMQPPLADGNDIEQNVKKLDSEYVRRDSVDNFLSIVSLYQGKS
jgi:hypothetical protein